MIRGSLSCVLAPSKYKRISQTMCIKYKEVSLLLGLYFSNIVFLLLVDRVPERDKILRHENFKILWLRSEIHEIKMSPKIFF